MRTIDEYMKLPYRIPEPDDLEKYSGSLNCASPSHCTVSWRNTPGGKG